MMRKGVFYCVNVIKGVSHIKIYSKPMIVPGSKIPIRENINNTSPVDIDFRELLNLIKDYFI